MLLAEGNIYFYYDRLGIEIFDFITERDDIPVFA